jgi:hypothetical protein
VRARLLLAATALLVTACGLPTGAGSDESTALRLDAGRDIVFRSDRGEYRHGQTAGISLRNRTARSLGYNLCASARERREGSSWTRIEVLRLCPDAYFELPPGAEATHPEPITPDWRPGTYRMVTTVVVLGTERRGEVVSSTFVVRP